MLSVESKDNVRLIDDDDAFDAKSGIMPCRLSSVRNIVSPRFLSYLLLEELLKPLFDDARSLEETGSAAIRASAALFSSRGWSVG